jgi:hypothetical protein
MTGWNKCCIIMQIDVDRRAPTRLVNKMTAITFPNVPSPTVFLFSPPLFSLPPPSPTVPSFPSMLSSDSESLGSSDTLSYTPGLLADTNLSAVLSSPDFGRRLQASETGLGSRPQGAGAMFPSSSLVCLLVLLGNLSGSSEAPWPIPTWDLRIFTPIRPLLDVLS